MPTEDEVRAAQLAAARANLELNKTAAGCCGPSVGCVGIVGAGIAAIIAIVCFWVLGSMVFGWGK